MSQSAFLLENDNLNNLQQLLFRIYRIDQTKRSKNWYIEKTDRPYFVFWYIISGEKTIYINDIEYTVQKNDLVVFPSEIPFEIIKGSCPLHHLEISLDIKFGYYNLMSMYNFPIITKLDNTQSTTRLIDLWKQLRKDWHTTIKFLYKANHDDHNNHFELKDAMKLIYFNSITLAWFNQILLHLSTKITSVPMLDSRLQSLFYYIYENLSNKITLDELAELIYVSKSHLIYLFKEHIGLPPMEYVRKLKMKKAKELLLTSNMALNEIAKRIGFDNQSQFSRAFRQDIGYSPTKYRQNERLF